MADLDHVEVTGDLTADFVMKAAWAAFPSSLTGQLGMVPSPGMLADPNGSRAPVGTGPFSFKEWVPDNHLTVVRNPHYWRSDSAGTPLPYLDQVDFKVIVEDASKLDATLAGDIDMAVSAVPADVIRIEQAAADGKLQAVQNQGETEEAFVQLNMAKPPFDNLTARQAMAYATDEQAYIATLDQNVTTPVYNVFREGTPYYREAPYPRYDLDKAKSLVQAYEQETGQPLAFSLASLATSDSRLQTQYLKSVWEQAGMKVDIVQTEQTKFIVDAVTGNYQAVAWGQFGSPDPDYDYVWWISDNAAPIGQLGLNIARNKDPEIDKALRAARATDDQKVRKDNYAIVAARLNQDLPYIWLARPPLPAVRRQLGAGDHQRPPARWPGLLPDGRPRRDQRHHPADPDLARPLIAQGSTGRLVQPRPPRSERYQPPAAPVPPSQ